MKVCVKYISSAAPVNPEVLRSLSVLPITCLIVAMSEDTATIPSYGEEAGGKESMKAGEKPTSNRSEEHTSELQSLMRISYAVFCLKKKINNEQPKYKHKT